MRITGLATGLDMDQLVKETMQPYRIKIQQQQQQKEITEIKQQLYRDVINESRELYNKYFDVAKTDSLLLSKNWSTVKFTSSNENVLTVTGGSDAKPGNYTVTGNTATAAKAIVTTGISDTDSIVVNGKKFTLQGDTAKARAENLNKELQTAGMNVSVRYSDFAGTEAGNKSGFIFESTVLGKDSTFTIGGTVKDVTIDKTLGENATPATVTGFSVSDFKYDANNTVTLTVDGNDVSIDISGASIKKDGSEKTDNVVDSEKLKTVLNEKLKEYKLSAEVTEVAENVNITFSSTVLGKDVKDPKININSSTGTFTSGMDAKPVINSMSLVDVQDQIIFVNGTKIDLSAKDSGEDEATYLNKIFLEKNIDAIAEIKDGNLILTSNSLGATAKMDVSIVDTSVSGFQHVDAGIDAAMIIKDDKGGVYTHTGTSNTLTLDGVTFKFTGEIPSEGISVNGKSDVTAVKDKVVNFINDYNKLMEKLNTLTTEKRNRNYMPLTDEQKKEMSENEIKLWDERVKKGQLYKDSDVSRIANSMKSAMRGLVEGVDGNLKSFGIEPVADYQGIKNGTYTIDETKLTEALENNSEEVMKLFINTPPSVEGMSEQEKYSKTGIAQRLKSILYNETVTTSSVLIKKAGVEGSASVANNELTKSIEKYERKMLDMEKDFSRREQQLYSKWATIESMMNKLNSQQSYLMSQLGMS